MPFIPHTEQDIKAMLAAIGIDHIEALFDEIPAFLRQFSLANVPTSLSEMELTRLMNERASQDGKQLCFIGAGAYEHHIPAAVWEIVSRGEFMTAYTPYQAEASQGNLQVIYEFQTMMASLMGLAVSNASLYDGATALAEAILMAVRIANKPAKLSILLPKTVHPHYRETVKTIVTQQHINLVELPYIKETGRIDINALKKINPHEIAALVIPQPNFFGVIEEVDLLTDWARSHDILTIAVVNPLAMALLKPPGNWGRQGADIACGEGQPLGIPLAGGGPYFGFLCCQKKHIRQLPGRIVGKTVDLDGKPGFVLTLQAREQHIRRSKATSNICTNQGLLVIAATVHMSLLGPQGLKKVALSAHQRMRELAKMLSGIPGIKKMFNAPFFHEMVFSLPVSADHVLAELAKHGIQGGFALKKTYPALADSLLICATETKTEQDLQLFSDCLQSVVEGGRIACLA